jgi:hypothetical protein
MLRNNKAMGFVLAVTVLLFMSGCYKDKTVILDTGEEITRPVGFTADIIPIFNSSCNSTGCHSAGGKSPDLSSANAYNTLIGGGFINSGEPDKSELYLWMTGKRGIPMPVSGINKEFNALVLAWIKQGAQNN